VKLYSKTRKTGNRTAHELKYNVGLSQSRLEQKGTGPVQVRPSLKLIRPLYYVGFIALALTFGWINNPSASEESRPWWPLILPLLFLIGVLVLHLKQRFHVLTIGGGKLRSETGMLSKTTRTMDLAKIQDVRVDQTLVQRMLGTGSIYIETAGESGGLTMKNIDRPQTVADYILEVAGK
jgi:uncharacterized membrane protein YdbT with pleckstrin-like domain